MKKKDNKELLKTYKEIAAILSEKNANTSNTINRYEYYKLGGIPFKEAFVVISDLYKKRKINSTEYSKLRDYFHRQMQLPHTSRSKDYIMQIHYQFGDYVITNEEKNNIWDGLHELGLSDEDIDDLIFSGAVRDYAYQKGLIKKIEKYNKVRTLKRK